MPNSEHSPDNLPAQGQVLVYQTEDGRVKLEVRLEDETVWLSQQHMVELFQSSRKNVSHHIKTIYDEGELDPTATRKKYLQVRLEGNREVQRQFDFYNLDMIISVGYRVKSAVATRFRIWATQKLREYDKINQHCVKDSDRQGSDFDRFLQALPPKPAPAKRKKKST